VDQPASSIRSPSAPPRSSHAEGAARYPGARRLLVTCDAGGSNARASRLWKDELAGFAAEAGLEIAVCHFPPGTSMWNKIEHRLFCHITRTWKTRPLMTKEDAVAGIAATTTYQGLKVTAVLDDAARPDGVKVSDQRMKYLESHVLDRAPFHGEWNYAVRPAPRGTPAPGPAPPRPGRVPRDVLNHPALTGVTPEDVSTLAAALETPYRARLDHKSHLKRGRRRASTVRSDAPHGNRRLDVTDHVLALRLRDHLNLPLNAIAALLGADSTSISHAVITARALITPPN
jgi:hypothetical protein